MATSVHAHPLRSVSGRVLYGALFVIALPVAMTAWARSAVGAIHVPVPQFAFALLVAALGVLIVLLGVDSLWRRGGGLPMNAFPPPHYVSTGLYAFVPHPIYGGFVITCGGIALWARSPAGLWLVTPAAALGCAALVLGYELPDLNRRFGPARLSSWMPADRPGSPTLLERLRVYFVVLLPWLVAYELIGYLGPAPDSCATYLSWESQLPVWPCTEPVYFSVYAAVLLAPLLLQTASGLRRFARRGLMSMTLIFPLYLLLPFYVPPRPFHAAGTLAALMQWERTPIAGAGAFPSFHVVWALIVVSCVGRQRRWLRIAGWAWAALVCASCVFTGMHSIADVVAGVAAFAIIVNLGGIWRAILRAAEHLANSWKEWRAGPVRIINHGAYAGAAAFVGMLVIQALTGRGILLPASICLCSLACAALWAQWVEGSPALLRPLGFYGGMIGAMLGALVAVPLHVNLWCAFAAVCVAAPWIQALGRLRCLVQGCCHGCAAETVAGIRCMHPRTRVCRLAHLAAAPIHATPVYSIVCNIVSGAVLFRLFELHVAAAFLCGIYLLLSGLGRFAEEAYRGEPQTRIVAGLRFYQWIAIVCVVGGAVLTCAQGTTALQGRSLNTGAVALAAAAGLLAWMISGLDFPESTRRFARLT